MTKGDQNQEYRVLARKYRPSTFDELIGQQAMVKTLGNAIDAGRLAHAFVMTGVRGVGKTTTARLIARALNCVGADGNGPVTVSPCGVCDNCVAIAESRHVDVLEMDAASRTGVDDIREIIESVRYAPVSARYKVYIIDEVHMLSKNAFNALLKTLEEPPPHVKFIFATTEIRKLPVTVLSRCQRFDLRRVESEDLIAHLRGIVEKESASIDDNSLAMIARAAEGSVRDSLSLLDQAIAHSGGTVSEAQVRDMLGLADRSRILELFEAIMAGKTADALDLMKGQYDLGSDPVIILKDLADVTHWLTRLKIVPDAGSDAMISESERTEGLKMAKDISMPALTRAWQMLLKGINETQSAPQPMAAAEMVVIRLAYAADLPSPADLVKTIKSGGGSVTAIGGGATGNGSTNGASAGTNNQPQASHANQPTTMVQGNNVIAMRPDESGDSTLDPMPQSYEAMAALFEKHRQGVISKYLCDDCRPVSYQPGKVELRPIADIPRTMPSQMKMLLQKWTGVDWLVSVNYQAETDEQTVTEILTEREEAMREEARQDPIVAIALKAFQGTDVSKTVSRFEQPELMTAETEGEADDDGNFAIDEALMVIGSEMELDD